MSTQRRENRWRGFEGVESAEGTKPKGFPFQPRPDHALATGQTARPDSPAPSATNSLHTDYRIETLVRPFQLDQLNARRAWPHSAAPCATAASPAARRAFLLRIPVLPGFASFRPVRP